MKQTILRLLDEHRLTTVATLRSDGWPQATTVGYASDGLVLCFICGADSQKAKNIGHDNRISLTVDHDATDPMGIEGLSMGARAPPVSDPDAIARVMGLLGTKFPEYRELEAPDMEQIRIMKAVPEVISVLDYGKGFGHSDLVTVFEEDLA